MSVRWYVANLVADGLSFTCSLVNHAGGCWVQNNRGGQKLMQWSDSILSPESEDRPSNFYARCSHCNARIPTDAQLQHELDKRLEFQNEWMDRALAAERKLKALAVHDDVPDEATRERRKARVEELRERFATVVRREHNLPAEFKVEFHPDALLEMFDLGQGVFDAPDEEWQKLLTEIDQGTFSKMNDDEEPEQIVQIVRERERDLRSGKRKPI